MNWCNYFFCKSMENQSSRSAFRENMITHFRNGWPENSSGEIIQLFSEMTYQEKKRYIRKLENLARENSDDMYLAEMIHLAKTILISTREHLAVVFRSDIVQAKILATFLALLILTAYSARWMIPCLYSKRKESYGLVW